MSDSITLAVGDGSRRMTYAELAAVRGTSVPSARRLVLRQRWPRQIGNDGLVRVTVPLSFVAADKGSRTDSEPVPVRRHMPTSVPTSVPTSSTRDPTDVVVTPATDVVVAAIEAAVAPLREQLQVANQRAERAERREDEECARADRAEQTVTALQAELVEARAAERGTSERTAATVAEITELRRLLDVADRRIQGERTRAEQERELRTQAQGRLADKDATITGLVAEQQAMRQQVETLTDLLRARRSWWRRMTGR